MEWYVHVTWDVKRLIKDIRYPSCFEVNSLTIGVLAGPSIIKVMAPIPITAGLNIIAVWLLSEGADAFGSLEIVGAINNLNIPEVAGLPESLFGEMTAAHLSGGVLPLRLRIHNFSSPLNHGGAVCQIREQEGWPIPQYVVIPELHPPVPLFRILQQHTTNPALCQITITMDPWITIEALARRQF